MIIHSKIYNCNNYSKMAMIQPLRNLYNGTANQQTEGCIRLYTRSGSTNGRESVICIKSYGSYSWEPLEFISAANWMRHREKISKQIPYLSSTMHIAETLQITQKREELQKKINADYEVKRAKDTMIRSLCDILTEEQRFQWLKEHEEFNKTVCIDCGQYAPCLIKHKCIHLDCPGMCLRCYNTKNPEGFETCACCNQKQELTCPICQDTHTLENMVKSDSCGHHVCWKCFGMSIKSTRPLSHCPLCRDIFCKNLTVVEVSDDDDDVDMIDGYDSL